MRSPSTDAARRGPSWRRILYTAAAVAVAGLALATLASYLYLRDVHTDVASHDLNATLQAEERPEKLSEARDILVIGSDVRADDSPYGGRYMEGERSDTLLLVHLSPDRDEVSAVNFPRDTLVELPECEATDDYEGTSGYYGMINAALYHGGPTCVVKTIESLTGIHIDHFVQFDFVGFREMIDAIGGVEMCIPEPLQDERSQLDLQAGRQHLDGEDALAFVRARREIGDGGDLGRIDRQQMFLGALAQEVTGGELLRRPDRIAALTESISDHVTTDTDLTLPVLARVGSTVAEVELDDIHFYTVPSWPAPGDPNRLVVDESLAAELFDSIAHDRPVPADLVAGGDDAATADAEDGPTDEAEPADTDDEPSGEEIGRRDATADPCADGLGTGTD